jgi:hypothetical protein
MAVPGSYRAQGWDDANYTATSGDGILKQKASPDMSLLSIHDTNIGQRLDGVVWTGLPSLWKAPVDAEMSFGDSNRLRGLLARVPGYRSGGPWLEFRPHLII